MKQLELVQLSPYFRDGERYLNGQVIDWNEVSFETMQAVHRLREMLDTRIVLIRGPHPDPDGTKPFKRTAVDACAPGVDLGQVAMALFRLQRVSYGLYSGNSFHIDTRPFTSEPARWMAIKPREEVYLNQQGLQEVVSGRADGWTYLNWSHPRASEALVLVLSLAKQQAGAVSAEV